VFDVILVRHAESQPDWTLPLPEWPLSERGRQQADDLVEQLAQLDPDYVFSSPYPRAIDTVQPFATRHGMSVEVLDDLRERKLSENAISPDDAFLKVMRQSFEDLDFKLPKGESNRQVASRAFAALERCYDIHGDSRILASSHGNTITALLAMLDPSVGYEEWKTLGNPALRRIVFDGSTWRRLPLDDLDRISQA